MSHVLTPPMFKAINTITDHHRKSIEREKQRLLALYDYYLKTKVLNDFALKNQENRQLLETIRLYVFYDQVRSMGEKEILVFMQSAKIEETPYLMALVVEKAISNANFTQAACILRYCAGKGIFSGKLTVLERRFKRVRRMRI